MRLDAERDHTPRGPRRTSHDDRSLAGLRMRAPSGPNAAGACAGRSVGRDGCGGRRKSEFECLRVTMTNVARTASRRLSDFSVVTAAAAAAAVIYAMLCDVACRRQASGFPCAGFAVPVTAVCRLQCYTLFVRRFGCSRTRRGALATVYRRQSTSVDVCLLR